MSGLVFTMVFQSNWKTEKKLRKSTHERKPLILSKQKSHTRQPSENAERNANKVRGKQIEFNKNGSPAAHYVGRELDKLWPLLERLLLFRCWFLPIVSIRFDEMQQKIIGSTTPFRMKNLSSASKRCLPLMFTWKIIRWNCHTTNRKSCASNKKQKKEWKKRKNKKIEQKPSTKA